MKHSYIISFNYASAKYYILELITFALNIAIFTNSAISSLAFVVSQSKFLKVLDLVLAFLCKSSNPSNYRVFL